MPDKPTPPAKPDDPAQSKRFIDMAREVGADERTEVIDEAFKKVIKPPAKVDDSGRA
jgi:hypothetical protein